MARLFRDAADSMHKDLKTINLILEETMPELIEGMKRLVEQQEKKVETHEP